MHASKMSYVNLNIFVNGSEIIKFDISELSENLNYFHRNKEMYNYFIPKAIIQRFSSFQTTFWK